MTFDRFQHASGEIWNGDCLELMQHVPDASVDMILCDLPYGTTACSWDSIIPFEPLWAAYHRIIKPRGAIVLFGAEPFSSLLRTSNLTWFKYDWIWKKSKALGFTNAKNKPMNKHEIISVFSEGTCANKSDRRMLYNPQDLVFHNKTVSGIKRCSADNPKNGGHGFARPGHKDSYVQEFTNYPASILEFNNEASTVHPTQKPVALFEYLIRTYTNEGAVILDNCSGSGTTAIAAYRSGRKSLCIEKDLAYYIASCGRVWGEQQ